MIQDSKLLRCCGIHGHVSGNVRGLRRTQDTLGIPQRRNGINVCPVTPNGIFPCKVLFVDPALCGDHQVRVLDELFEPEGLCDDPGRRERNSASRKSSHGGAQPGGRAAAGNIGDIEIPGTLYAEAKEMNTRPRGREALSRRLAAGPSKNRRT